MKAHFPMASRAVSLAREWRFTCFVAILLTLLLGGCANDNMATKSPEDGSDYPGWAKAASTPFTIMSHQSSF